MKVASVTSTENITSTSFTDLLEKSITVATGNAIKVEFTASVSAAYFSTVKFKLLVDDEPVSYCTEDVTDDGYASLAMQATIEASEGEHTVKVQACKAESANATVVINPATTDHATLTIEEVELELDPGLSEFALSFDGSDDNLVAAGYKGVTGTAARSFSWWMKLDAIPGYGSLFNCGSVSPTALWENYLANDSGACIIVSLYGGAIGWREGDNSDMENVADNEWHHFVITGPASGTAADLKLYMDSVEQTVPHFLGSSATVYSTGSTYDLAVAERFTDSSINLEAMFDEIAVFSSELAAAEVAAIYNSGQGLDLTSDSGDYESSADLELYYKLEEGTGTEAADSSGNGRDGDVTGATWVAGISD